MTFFAARSAGCCRWLSLRFLLGAELFVSIAEHIEQTHCPELAAQNNAVQAAAVAQAVAASLPPAGEARLRAVVGSFT